ncbi:zinc ribbon domain-containing protein [Methanobacterium oryzae]|uniref:zinc ribbon domain-containing protein n=1 Tax=Methanobacterium oryzae TaxID=69540 RepID=UPI003D218509
MKSSLVLSINTDNSIVCPHCGSENPDVSKFCMDCGQQFLDNENSNLVEEHSGEKILGSIFAKNFFSTLGATETFKAFSLFFTNNRVLIVETVNFKSRVATGHMNKARKVHKQLVKMNPDEIFSSEWPCLSVPYSQIEKLKISKGFFTKPYVKITASGIQEKYNVMPLGLRVKMGFVDELKPILGDKVKIRR